MTDAPRMDRFVSDFSKAIRPYVGKDAEVQIICALPTCPADAIAEAAFLQNLQESPCVHYLHPSPSSLPPYLRDRVVHPNSIGAAKTIFIRVVTGEAFDVSAVPSTLEIVEFWMVAMLKVNLLTNASCCPLSGSQLLSAYAEAGWLVPHANMLCTYDGAFFARFKPFSLRICTSVQASDAVMQNLHTLEEECWEPGLRLSEDKIRTRLNLPNSPPFFVLPLATEEVVGVLYVQRIASVADLEGVTFTDIETRHKPDGQHIELLSINIHPKVELGFGNVLRTFALCTAQLSSIRSVVAITRCRKFTENPGVEYEEYLRQCASGVRSDPGISFHLSGGAQFTRVVRDFRPEDVGNDGCGVLITYDLQHGDASANAKKDLPKMSATAFFELLQTVTMDFFGFELCSPTATWTEIGFDSLTVLEFALQLQRELSLDLPPTVFYDFPTAEALMYKENSPCRAILEAAPVVVGPKKGVVAGEKIAITSVACRFPSNCGHPAEFWSMLLHKKDCVCEIPYSRWNIDEFFDESPNPSGEKSYARYGGFMKGVDMFDPVIFGISVNEAKTMDPQQRILLEVAYEAFSAAGYTKESLKNSNTGVFVGQSNNDWGAHLSKYDIGVYDGTGISSAITANRVSFIFDLKGPSMTIDTACSSSLSALHTAKDALLRGTCDVALVAAVDIIHDPRTLALRARPGMLAHDGRCRTFDASASGYVRGEGCGAIVLQRASDAEAAANPILAYISGSALNQDGKSSTLTAPNGPAQQEVIRAALREANIDPWEVDYVETHGTGTALGDPIEVSALKGVLNADRSHPLVLGAVKTNIGHLEAAAGIAGIIKTVLVLHHRQIPPNLHLSSLNPHFNLKDFLVDFAPSLVDLSERKYPLVAGVSSFGFGGTNAHVVLTEAPPSERAASVLLSPSDIKYNRRSFPLRRDRYFPILGRKVHELDDEVLFSNRISSPIEQLFSHHKVNGEVVVPVGAFLEMALEAAAEKSEQNREIVISDMCFTKPLILNKNGEQRAVHLKTTVAATRRLEIMSSGSVNGPWHSHAKATLSVPGVETQSFGQDINVDLKSLKRNLTEKTSDEVEKMYDIFSASGLEYLSRFRTIHEVFCGADELLVHVVLGEHEWQFDFMLHPSLTAASLQLLTLLSSDRTYSPQQIVSVERIVYSRCSQPESDVWLHATVTSHTEDQIVANLRYVRADGSVSFLLDGCCLKMDPLVSLAQNPKTATLYEVDWVPAPHSTFKFESQSASRWLFVGLDQHSLPAFKAKFPSSTFFSVDFEQKQSPVDAVESSELEAFRNALQDPSYRGVVFAAALSTYASDVDVINMASSLLRESAAKTNMAVIFLTIGTQPISMGSAGDSARKPYHGGLWGLAITSSLELPNLPVRCIDIDASAQEPEAALTGWLKSIVDSDEVQVALKVTKEEKMSIFVRRLAQSSTQCAVSQRVTAFSIGHSLFSSVLAASPLPDIGSTDVVIRLFAAGLYSPTEASAFSSECASSIFGDVSGIVVAIGDDVTNFKIGDAVFGIASDCLRSYVVTAQSMLAVKPSNWSFEDAVAMPTGSLIVKHFLKDKAWKDLKVLVLGAYSHLGLLALDLLQQSGALLHAAPHCDCENDLLNRGINIFDVSTESRVNVLFDVVVQVEDGLGDINVPALLETLSYESTIRVGPQPIVDNGVTIMSTPWMDVLPGSFPQLAKEMTEHLWNKPSSKKVFNGFSSSLQGLRWMRLSCAGKAVVSVAGEVLHTGAENTGVIDSSATYVITGGLGGLGLMNARVLVELGARHLVLMSRSGKIAATSEHNWEWLSSSCADIRRIACDVSKDSDIQQLQELLSTMPPMRGIFHAAGVIQGGDLEDRLLTNQTVEKVRSMYGGKVSGAWKLHNLAERLHAPLDFFVVYSSVSSLFGFYGQANYAAANACLDSIIHWRRSRGLVGQAIQWGPVGEVGLLGNADSKAYEKSGMFFLDNRNFADGLYSVLRSSCAQVAVARIDWATFSKVVFLPRFTQAFTTRDESTTIELPSSTAQQEVSKKLEKDPRVVVAELLRNLLGEDIDANEPLSDAGVDSLGAIEFRNSLADEFPSITIPSTLVFDYPTVDDVVNFLLQHGMKVKPDAVAANVIHNDEPIAIIGLSCHFPGADNTQSFWDNLCRSKSFVTEIPLSRWNLDDSYHPEKDVVGKTYTKYGGFIRGAEFFDPAFFGITFAEAKTMDPQQRLMLHVATDAFNRAGRDKESLAGSNTGIFIGQCNYDWLNMPTSENTCAFDGTGCSPSITANRLSFMLGLKGPSLTVDTACSSSLVAFDCAMDKLRRGKCDMALAAGVNLMLSPAAYVVCSQAHMLSPDSDCRTFDEGAKGYVKGEGCGAVVLKRLCDAEAAGDPILAVVRGSAVNQDGRSACLTAPNGPSQEAAIRAALREAQIAPSEVDYVETHGTGTSLGDPIEVGAIKAVLSENRDVPLVLGAVKGNIGHLEGAAGIAALIKTVLVLHHRRVPPNRAISKLNSHFDLSDFQVDFAISSVDLSERKYPLVAGVSSFGFGGTNSHVILTEAPPSESATSVLLSPSALKYNRRSFPLRKDRYFPILGRKVREVDGEVHFVNTISSPLEQLFSHHKVNGEMVTPIGAFLEIALEAAAEKSEVNGFSSMCFTKPLLVHKSGEERRIHLKTTVSGASRLEIWSAESGDGPWHSHATATLSVPQEEVATFAQEASVDLETLKRRLTGKTSDEVEKMYDIFSASGLEYLSRFRTIHEVFCGADELLVHVVLGEHEWQNGFMLHPALTAASLQMLKLLSSDHTYAPQQIVSVERVLYSLCCQPELDVWLHATVTSRTEDQIVTNLRYVRADGSVSFLLDGCCLKMDPLVSFAQNPRIAMLYEVDWVPSPQTVFKFESQSASRWLFVGVDQHSLSTFKAKFPSSTFFSVDFEQKQSPVDAVEASELEAFRNALQDPSYRGVVFAAGLSKYANEVDVINMASSLLRESTAKTNMAVVFLTIGTQPISIPMGSVCDSARKPYHGGLWGLASTSSLELPNLPVRCIDIDS